MADDRHPLALMRCGDPLDRVQHTPTEVLGRFSVEKHVPALLEHHPLADPEQHDRVHELLDARTVLAGYVTKDLDLPQIGKRVRLQPVVGGDLRTPSPALATGCSCRQRRPVRRRGICEESDSLALTDLPERRIEHVAERPARLGFRLLAMPHEQQ